MYVRQFRGYACSEGFGFAMRMDPPQGLVRNLGGTGVQSGAGTVRKMPPNWSTGDSLPGLEQAELQGNASSIPHLPVTSMRAEPAVPSAIPPSTWTIRHKIRPASAANSLVDCNYSASVAPAGDIAYIPGVMR